MKDWKVGVAYERYGYIRISADEAKTEEEAIAAAKKKLDAMDMDELEEITSPLEDTAKIDKEGVIHV